MLRSGSIRLRLLAALVALAAATCLPGIAQAQQYYDPGILYNPIMRKPSSYASGGVRLGSFVMSAGLGLQAEKHDNIYYLNEDEIDDVIYHARPSVSLGSTWSRHGLSVKLDGDMARYRDNPSEDYNDARLSVDGRIDVQRGRYFSLGATTNLLHEDRSSPEDPGGLSPVEFNFTSYSLGYHHTFNRLTADLTYFLRVSAYDDTFDEDGNIIDNSDRDRKNDSLRFRADYMAAPQRTVFLELSTNGIAYDQETDNEGFARSSDGYVARAGAAWDITGVLTGEAWLNYAYQDYDDPTLGTIDDLGLGASLYWTPTRLTDVSVLVARTVQETIQPDTAGYLSALYSARVQHELRRWLLLNASLSYTDNDYKLGVNAEPDALSETRVVRAGLGLSYLFSRRVNLSAGYSFEKQDSNVAIQRYESNRVFLTLGLTL